MLVGSKKFCDTLGGVIIGGDNKPVWVVALVAWWQWWGKRERKKEGKYWRAFQLFVRNRTEKEETQLFRVSKSGKERERE